MWSLGPVDDWEAIHISVEEIVFNIRNHFVTECLTIVKNDAVRGACVFYNLHVSKDSEVLFTFFALDIIELSFIVEL